MAVSTKNQSTGINISGHTQPFAVLGHPIGHTLSPVMHNAAFRALGMDAVYLAFNVAPEHLPAVIEAMEHMGFRGVNLTVPLKEVAYHALADLDPSAQMLGAVNTLERCSHGWRGHNTDGYGFVQALYEAFGIRVGGLSVLVLGVGGAGRAVAITCASEGARKLFLTDAAPARAQQVAQALSQTCPALPVITVPAKAEALERTAREADLIVQATPVGMRPEDPPLLGPNAFRRGHFVLDLIYMYPCTAFMRVAAEAGAKTVNGLGMLLHQGARAFDIWTGRSAPLDVMRTALEAAVYGKCSGGGP